MAAWAGVALCGALALRPEAASAHLIGIEFGPFYAGALHVVTGIEYVATLLGISLLASLQTREAARWVLVCTPVALLCGAALAGAIRWDIPAAMAVMLLLAIIGLLCALRPALHPAQLAVVAVASTSAVAYVNGLAIESGGSLLWLHASGVTAIGTVIVTLATAAFTGLAARAKTLEVLYRIAGSWIGAIGLIMFSLTIIGRTV